MKTLAALLASLASFAAAQEFGGGQLPGGFGSEMTGNIIPDDIDTSEIMTGDGGFQGFPDGFIEGGDADMPPVLAPREPLPPLPPNAIDASLMIARHQPRHVYAGEVLTLEYSVMTPWPLDLARADVIAHLSFGFGPQRAISVDDVLKVSAVAAGSNHTGPPPRNIITIDIPYAVCMRENPAKVVNVTLVPLGVQQPTPGHSAPIEITCFTGLGQQQWIPAMYNYFAACLPSSGGEGGLPSSLPDVTTDMVADDFVPPTTGVTVDDGSMPPPPGDDVPQPSMPPGGDDESNPPPPPSDDSVSLPSPPPLQSSGDLTTDPNLPPPPPPGNDTMPPPPSGSDSSSNPLPPPPPLSSSGSDTASNPPSTPPPPSLRRALQEANQQQCPTLAGACNPTYCRPRPRCMACNRASDVATCCANLAGIRSGSGLSGCLFEADVCRTALPRRIDLDLLREQMDGEGRIDAAELMGDDGRVNLDLTAASGSFRLQLGNDRANASAGGMAPPMEIGSIRIGCDGCNATMRQVVQVDAPVRFNEETRVRPGGELLLESDVELSQDLQVDAGASIELRGSLTGSGNQRARVSGDARIAPGTSMSGVSFEVEAGGVARMEEDNTILRLREGANFTVASSATLELSGAGSRIEAAADAGAFTNAGRLVVRASRNATLDAAGRRAPQPPVARINSTVINNGEMDVESGELILEGGVRNTGRLSVRPGGSMQLGGSSTFDRQSGNEDQQVQVEGVLRLQPNAVATFRAPINSTGRVFAGRNSVMALDSEVAADASGSVVRSILGRPKRAAGAMTAAQEVVAQRSEALSPRQASSLETQFSAILGGDSAAAQDLSSIDALDAALEMLHTIRIGHLSLPFRLRQHRIGAPIGNASQVEVLAELADRIAQVEEALNVARFVGPMVTANEGSPAGPYFNAVVTAFANANVSDAVHMGEQLGAGVAGEAPLKTHQMLAAVAVFASGGHLRMPHALQLHPAQLLDLVPLAQALAFPQRGPMRRLVHAVHRNATDAPAALLEHVRLVLNDAGLDAVASGLPARVNPHDVLLLASDTIALSTAARRQDAALDCAGSLEVMDGSAVTLSADGVVEGVLRVKEGASMDVQPQEGEQVTLGAADAQVAGQLSLQNGAAFDVQELSLDGSGLLNLDEGGNMTLLEPSTAEALFGAAPGSTDTLAGDQQQPPQPPPQLRRVLRGPATKDPSAVRRVATTHGIMTVSGRLDGTGPMTAGSVVVTSTGAVAPGGDHATGAMQVDGDVEFQAGSNLLLDVLSPTEFDRLDVTGTLTLGGRVLVMGAAAPEAPPLTASAIETTATLELEADATFELGHDNSGRSVGSDGETSGPDSGPEEPKDFPLEAVVGAAAAIGLIATGLLVYCCCCRRTKSQVSSKYVAREQEPQLIGAAAIGRR